MIYPRGHFGDINEMIFQRAFCQKSGRVFSNKGGGQIDPSLMPWKSTGLNPSNAMGLKPLTQIKRRLAAPLGRGPVKPIPAPNE